MKTVIIIHNLVMILLIPILGNAYDKEKIKSCTVDIAKGSFEILKGTVGLHSNNQVQALKDVSYYLCHQQYNPKRKVGETVPDKIIDIQYLINKQVDAVRVKEFPNYRLEGGFFKKLMGNVLEDTCESNYDCESPEVCCDFGFKKMCCSSGLRVLDGPPRSRYGEYAEVPVIANPGPNYPPNPPSRY